MTPITQKARLVTMSHPAEKLIFNQHVYVCPLEVTTDIS